MGNELEIFFRRAELNDLNLLDSLRQESFAPIFASFRKILGEEIYELAQRREDEDQKEILASMFSKDSEWKLFVAALDSEIVGFVSIQINMETTVGEIGLNAVKPSYSG